MSIAKQLIEWYQKNGRNLPWRHTRDPYIIWLSEIILQQTRVEQGMPYFYTFVENFPNVGSFAQAKEEDILRLWQGLGYYSRARNMHKAAKLVLDKFGGVFPTSYCDVIELPGVGEYTAAAISSFSVDEPKAVLDGNVYRVLSRYFGIDIPINTPKAKKVFIELANEMLSQESPSLYNQAIMDFGAMVCKPKLPNCELCVLNTSCVAFQESKVDQLPVKIKSKASINRYFNYFVVERNDEILMAKRDEKDVWANLYEFPMIETGYQIELPELMSSPEYIKHFGKANLEQITVPTKHLLSHQNIFATFYRLVYEGDIILKKDNWNYYNSKNLDKLAKHKLIYSFLDKYLDV